jgi:hypothetical protein
MLWMRLASTAVQIISFICLFQVSISRSFGQRETFPLIHFAELKFLIHPNHYFLLIGKPLHFWFLDDSCGLTDIWATPIGRHKEV